MLDYKKVILNCLSIQLKKKKKKTAEICTLQARDGEEGRISNKSSHPNPACSNGARPYKTPQNRSLKDGPSIMGRIKDACARKQVVPLQRTNQSRTKYPTEV